MIAAIDPSKSPITWIRAARVLTLSGSCDSDQGDRQVYEQPMAATTKTPRPLTVPASDRSNRLVEDPGDHAAALQGNDKGGAITRRVPAVGVAVRHARGQ